MQHHSITTVEEEGTLGASVATPVLQVDTVSHNSPEMTISSSVTADVSMWVLAIITTVTADAVVVTISLVSRISAMILDTIEAIISKVCRAIIRAMCSEDSV